MLRHKTRPVRLLEGVMQNPDDFGSMPLGPAMPNGEFEIMSIPISRKVGTVGPVLWCGATPQVTSSRKRPALTSCAHAAQIRDRVDVATSERVRWIGIALERDDAST